MSGEEDESCSALHVRGSKHWKGPEYHWHFPGLPPAASSKSGDIHCLGAMLFAMVVGANLTGWERLDRNWPVSVMPCKNVSWQDSLDAYSLLANSHAGDSEAAHLNAHTHVWDCCKALQQCFIVLHAVMPAKASTLTLAVLCAVLCAGVGGHHLGRAGGAAVWAARL